MLMYVKAGQGREGTGHHPPILLSDHQLRDKGLARYIMTRTELGGSQLPDEKDRNSPRNLGFSLAIQPFDTAASLRIFHR
jgi:hypothetical protein